MTRTLLLTLAIVFTFIHPSQALISAINPINEQWIDSDHAQLFCRTIGKGKPLIVLHGGPGLSQDYLLPQLYKLAEDNFVIFYDQRGSGQSTGAINLDTINIDTFVNDLDNIRKAFNLKTISLLGHSWGGFLAMEYAIAHPERVEKLILSNSAPSSSDGYALFRNEWLLRTAPYQEEMAILRDTPGFKEGNSELREQYYRILFRAYCHNPEHANLLNLHMSPTAIVNGAQILDIMQQNVFEKPHNLGESLSNLSIPTLVIHGDDDIVPHSTAQVTHECVDGSSYILMQNCGHFPYVEDPDVYFECLKH